MPSHYNRRKKRRFSSKRKSAYAVAKKALHISKFLQKALEIKHVTYDVTALATSWSGSISQNLNSTIQGSNDTERIGDSIFCNSLYLGLNLVKGNDDCTVRVIGFWDKQNTILNPADLIDSVGGPLATVSDIHIDQRRDWARVFDKKFVLTSSNTSTAMWVKRFKLRKRTQFNQGTANINQGRLALMYITDIAVGQPIADYPIINAFGRVYYTDL